MKTIICDWYRTLYNPQGEKMYADSLYFLENLKEQNLILVTSGKNNKKYNLGETKKYFKYLYLNKKNKNIFDSLKNEFSNSTIWVIGDKLNSEILFGNRCQFKTIRILRNKFKNEKPTNKYEIPNFEVKNLKQALKIILSK